MQMQMAKACLLEFNRRIRRGKKAAAGQTARGSFVEKMLIYWNFFPTISLVNRVQPRKEGKY